MKRLVLWALGWYRQYRGLRPDSCRFSPSCTTYASEAVQRHGVVRGVALSVRRLGRCHPFGGSGYDPVPESTSMPSADKGAPVASATAPSMVTGNDLSALSQPLS